MPLPLRSELKDSGREKQSGLEKPRKKGGKSEGFGKPQKRGLEVLKNLEKGKIGGETNLEQGKNGGVKNLENKGKKWAQGPNENPEGEQIQNILRSSRPTKHIKKLYLKKTCVGDGHWVAHHYLLNGYPISADPRRGWGVKTCPIVDKKP